MNVLCDRGKNLKLQAMRELVQLEEDAFGPARECDPAPSCQSHTIKLQSIGGSCRLGRLQVTIF